MKVVSATKVSVILTIIVMLSSCNKVSVSYSTTPSLKYNGLEVLKNKGKDSVINISLSYTDGDGDIGLNSSDTFPPFNFGSPYFYNLKVDYISIENGIEVPVIIPLTSDTINFNDRITVLTPTGKDKAISGDLTLHLGASPYPGLTPDSVFFRITLFDRSLKKSNQIVTPVIKLIL
ncbi:MAG: hypothetical protein H7321_02290 [Bacteroidia bacterium]|nr:hypothetical protein [Bacteroidia bacterium]